VRIGWALFKNGPVRTGGWRNSAKLYTTEGMARAAAKSSGNASAVVRPVFARLELETYDE
jgi:hypothetical protein